MYSIEILTVATQELQDSFDWYQEQSLELGYDLVDEVNHYLDMVSSNPYQFSVRFTKKYRFATLNRFPYQIIYRVDERKKQVYVTAIFHTSRKPKKFKN